MSLRTPSDLGRAIKSGDQLTRLRRWCFALVVVNVVTQSLSTLGTGRSPVELGLARLGILSTPTSTR